MPLEKFVSLRNFVSGGIYRIVLRPIFFSINPEDIHDIALSFGSFLGKHAITRFTTKFFFYYKNNALRQNICGISFPNPVGLAAGFDKNAVMTDILPDVGFGFAEVGSITGEPCSGNPRPRLWRLKKSKSLLVNYGLNNDGCEAVAKRLKKKKFGIPLGISIAKTNSIKTVTIEDGIKDYMKAYKTLKDIGDYHTINISCPNAYGGLPFTDAKKLDGLLKRIGSARPRKPIFLKLSPDLSRKEIDSIILLAGKYGISGFVCTNLSKDNNKIKEKNLPGNGGISGKPVEKRSNDMIGYIYKKTKGKFTIIGCGGIFTAEDAYKKIKLGASLVQLMTGMIYNGPQLISEINQGLVKLLKKDGFSSISEAVGSWNKH